MLLDGCHAIPTDRLPIVENQAFIPQAKPVLLFGAALLSRCLRLIDMCGEIMYGYIGRFGWINAPGQGAQDGQRGEHFLTGRHDSPSMFSSLERVPAGTCVIHCTTACVKNRGRSPSCRTFP